MDNLMKNNFIQKRALKLAKQKVTSKTMNKLKPVSKGGTKLTNMLDLKIATIEMSETIRRTQSSLRGKQDRVWRANI